MCVSVCRYDHISAGACGVQKKLFYPLELQLKAVVSYLTWMLGTKLRSFARAIHASPLSHLSSPPVQDALSV